MVVKVPVKMPVVVLYVRESECVFDEPLEAHVVVVHAVDVAWPEEVDPPPIPPPPPPPPLPPPGWAFIIMAERQQTKRERSNKGVIVES